MAELESRRWSRRPSALGRKECQRTGQAHALLQEAGFRLEVYSKCMGELVCRCKAQHTIEEHDGVWRDSTPVLAFNEVLSAQGSGAIQNK